MAGVEFEPGSDFQVDFNGTAKPTVLLDIVHFNYPWVLLVVFLATFIVNSILSVPLAATVVEPAITGPGGKPLPRNAKKSKEEKEKRRQQDFSPVRKLVFIYLSAGVILTFIGSAINILVHALTKRENGWWCGEATSVSVHNTPGVFRLLSNSFKIDIRLRLCVLLRHHLDITRRHYPITRCCPSGNMDLCICRRRAALWCLNRALYAPTP